MKSSKCMKLVMEVKNIISFRWNEFEVRISWQGVENVLTKKKNQIRKKDIKYTK